ncbi:NADPH-dependent 7-cyano-7-deazaguanine reductase QueF [Alloalcanivorax mobilis]|uniref:NADPH-dependent 7-cyano-7-deazaguanine reductase QueF n=1 Tax=Alloalcanivorax mobilis TaxID=2019569 RepID=UPI000B5B0D5B|nr:NADPH-dependent 7-cyano-7-deazaguanine reductase QueF [Alloalcanivorax mobilis]ASK33538.1 NADPH-dependent 7-cyano-7-deazaguanine reductase QueF [Alcanivorax sp. N3-2A]|tara:strand:- start:1258 stop:2082 length:825 start_codon:yes stop_codon:yes gene_type:complete
MSLLHDTPLGRASDYVDQYTPALLCPVPRWDAREGLELENSDLPFHGMDLWNAYELSWLNGKGKPMVAVAELTIPCTSANIVESKSLKLYLNSFANTRFESREAVIAAIEKDVAHTIGAPLDVRILSLKEAQREPLWEDHGQCVDGLDVSFEGFEYSPDLLFTDQGPEQSGVLFSHLLRSHCPVTNQPDWATVMVRYTGAPISPASLLRYVVSLRNHQGFHEQIIEQMFIDIQRRCAPRQLTVYGRFTRRGGIDINPFRSNFETLLPNARTVRQ